MRDHPLKQRCCEALRLLAENQMVLVWSLGQKWQCLFFSELGEGGVCNLTLVFPCSCVLAEMMRRRDRPLFCLQC